MRWANRPPQYDLLDAEETATLGSRKSNQAFSTTRPNRRVRAFTCTGCFRRTSAASIRSKATRTAAFSRRAAQPLALGASLAGNREDPPASGMQVVPSDYLAPDGTNRELTLDGNAGRFDANRLEGRKGSRCLQPCQSVAPGNPAFSRFYPSGRNVFGVRDEAGDLKQGVVCSYLIVGWFAHAGDDPLSGGADRADWLARMTKLEWSVREATSTLPAGDPLSWHDPGREMAAEGVRSGRGFPPVRGRRRGQRA